MFYSSPVRGISVKKNCVIYTLEGFVHEKFEGNFHVQIRKVNFLVFLCRAMIRLAFKTSFHSGKLSVDGNGQENVSLSCELWVGTNDFNTKKNVPVRSNPRIIFLSGN